MDQRPVPEGEHNDIDPSTTELMDALEAFALANTWEEVYRTLLERQHTLLSSLSLMTIQHMILDFYREDRRLEAENWQQHLDLLEDICRRGITPAWEDFMLQQKIATKVLEAFARAITEEKQQRILQTYQKIFLSKPTLVILRNHIQTALPGDAKVEQWWQLLRWLEDTRQA